MTSDECRRRLAQLLKRIPVHVARSVEAALDVLRGNLQRLAAPAAADDDDDDGDTDHVSKATRPRAKKRARPVEAEKDDDDVEFERMFDEIEAELA